MTVPSGVSLGTVNFNFRCARPSANAALAALPVGSLKTSRFKTGMSFASSNVLAHQLNDAPAR